MKTITSIRMVWYANSLFFYLLTTLLIIGAFPLFLWDKVAFFMLLKQWHHPVADYMAPYLTWLGDGRVYALLLAIVALLRASCRKVLIMGGSFVCMSIVVQLLKRIFFSYMLRPIALLPVDGSLHLVDGVPLLTHLSFPSGHSATIFVLVAVIQLLSKHKKKIHSIILLAIALMVAYARIYLVQHFYTDVYLGAWIGTVAAVVVYLRVNHLHGPDWLDRSIYFLLYRHGKGLPVKK